jgi:hypothetical protein
MEEQNITPSDNIADIDEPTSKTIKAEQETQEPPTDLPPVPTKRPVGRPRKYPLPPATNPPPKSQPPQQQIQDIEDMFQVSSRDIQKFILKKKIKKYVSKYMEKYHSYPQQSASSTPTHHEQAKLDPVNEAYIDQAENLHSHLAEEHVGGQDSIAPDSKLAQILGMNKKNKNMVRR